MEDYLSVCDGIGCVEEAWRDLGWRPVLLSEIDPFPRAVLKHRHGAADLAESGAVDRGTPLWGDFTALKMRHLIKFGVTIPSLLVGGTPCQAFSIAGLRKSLDDDRGNLTLMFVKLANAIDNLRRARGEPPIVIVWENVPGVLSTKDNAFGCFLGAMVGADSPLVPGKRQRWSNAGMVVGPRRKAAWRTLDAQYFRLAQRRRRVFVVASARDGFDPGAVLFESEGVRRHSPPSREAGQGIADAASASTGGGGLCHDVAPALTSSGRSDSCPGETRGQDPVIAVPERLAFGGNNRGGAIDVAASLSANKTGSGQFYDFTVETFIAESVHCVTGDIARTLKADGFDASEDGTGRGTPIIAATLLGGARKDGGDSYDDIPLVASAIPIQESGKRTGTSSISTKAGDGIGADGDPMYTLGADSRHAVAVDVHQVASTLDASTLDASFGRLHGASNQDLNHGHSHLVAIAYNLEHGLAPHGSLTGEEVAPAIGHSEHKGHTAVLAYNLSPGAGSDGAPSAVETEVANAVTAEGEASKNGRGLHVVETIAFDTTQITSPTNRSQPKAGDPCHPLVSSGHPPAIAFSSKDHGADAEYELSPTLRAGNHDRSHENGGVPPAIAFALRGREDGALPEVHEDGQTIGTLRAADGGSSRDFVAIPITADALRGAGAAKTAGADSTGRVRLRDPGLGVGRDGDPAITLTAAGPGAVGTAWAGAVMVVRRLTVIECARLQGFPDGFTLIPWGNPPVSGFAAASARWDAGRKPKWGRIAPAEECPDGPQYKSYGNSMARPVITWLGQRIAMHTAGEF